MFDHVFYINSEEELIEYENITDFVELIFIMAMDWFEDLEDVINGVFIRFCDIETNLPKFGINIYYDFEADELCFGTVDFSNLCRDCNCEYCDSEYDDEYSDDEDYEYYFGFDF